jgi:hypothetical protein
MLKLKKLTFYSRQNNVALSFYSKDLSLSSFRSLKTLTFGKFDETTIKKHHYDLQFSIYKAAFDRSLANQLAIVWQEKLNERLKERRNLAKESRDRWRYIVAKFNQAKRLGTERAEEFFLVNPASLPRVDIENNPEPVVRRFFLEPLINLVNFDSFSLTGIPDTRFDGFTGDEQMDPHRVETEHMMSPRQLIEAIKHQMLEAGIVPTVPVYVRPFDDNLAMKYEAAVSYYSDLIPDIAHVDMPTPVIDGERTKLSDENPIMFSYHIWPINRDFPRRRFRERKMKMMVKVSALKLPPPVLERFKGLAGSRYNPETDVLTLVSSLFPTKTDNKFVVKRRLRQLLEEAWKADPNYLPLKPDQIQPLDFDPKYKPLHRCEIANPYDPKEMKELEKKAKEEEQKRRDEERKLTSFRISPDLASPN